MTLVSLGSLIPIALLLGVGLAMDSFGISISHGFKNPKITIYRTLIIAGVFGFFQGLMPMIGWAIVYGFSSIKSFSDIFRQIVPPLAFLILTMIGVGMIRNCYSKKEDNDISDSKKSFALVLIAQAIATSIDALSSGLAMNNYKAAEAGISVAIITLVTFGFCIVGVYLGKRFGHKFGNKSELIGGIILIFVGILILVKGEISINAPHIIPSWLEWFF
ncbi:MAG: manganese efflux pump MntP family protein, partial [Bacilli bacterium]|nr:manganese efflux pump MntP family protein [Bacilli bacterium]